MPNRRSRQPRRPYRFVGLTLMLVSFLAVYGLSRVRAPEVPVRSQGASATAAPTVAVLVPDPVLGAQEAIDRSLALFPEAGEPYGITVRLLSLYTYESWLGGGPLPGETAVPAQYYLAEGINPKAPIWLVGVRGTGLSVPDVVHPPPGVHVRDTRSVDGAYYAWDAQNGDLITEGALMSGSYHTILTIAAVRSQTIPIASEPPDPTPTLYYPEATVTWDPEDLATSYAALTAQAQTPPPTP